MGEYTSSPRFWRLSCTYELNPLNRFTAVSDFSLEVNEGEFMVIVGPSGSGKTTLLRMIAGLERPTAGDVYLDGRRANDFLPKDRDIAMVFQNYALYPHMNVYQNLSFALRMWKVPKDQIRQRVNQIAQRLDLEPLLSRKPQTLSGGQRQRVALGRALVRHSKVLLFDEPLSNLDPRLRTQMRTELQTLRREFSRTAIYVTHNQTEAMALGDRICVVHSGVIQQAGSPMEIYAKPANPFVAGFFGSPGMNFFPGRIQINQNTTQIILGTNRITLPAWRTSELSKYQDMEVVLGVRPEHVAIHCGDKAVPDGISARVDTIEFLGGRNDVYLTADSGHRCVVTTQSHSKLQENDVVTIQPDKRYIHIFST